MVWRLCTGSTCAAKALERPKQEKPGCGCYSVVRKENDLLPNYMPQRRFIRNSDAVPTTKLETA